MFIKKLKEIANTLTGTAKDFADAVVAELESLLANTSTEFGIEEVKAVIDKKFDEMFKANEARITEKVAALRQELTNVVALDMRDKVSADVKRQVLNAIMHNRGADNVLDAVRQVALKNDLKGLSAGELIDYSLEIGQDDGDEIFDRFRPTARTKFFFAELDGNDAKQIAKQWPGLNGNAVKAIQELAVNGKTLSTAYIYKRLRIANEDLDAAEDNGQLAELQRDAQQELTKSVKALAVRAALIGDTVNAAGERVTTFEAIKRALSDAFVTVFNGSADADIAVIRTLAESVKTDGYKVAVMDSATKLAIMQRIYGEGGTPVMLSNDELAGQCGVNAIVVKDYMNGDVIVFDTSAYVLKNRKTRNFAYPVYDNNSLALQYEMNIGGMLRKLKSAAVYNKGE